MKRFIMVLLASASLALPAAAAQQQQRGQMSQHGQKQGRSVQNPSWSGRQDSQMQSRIRAQNLSSDQISKIQRALRDAGFRGSKVDGEWGPNTRQALKNFQQNKGLAATGQLNRRALSALGLDPQRFATGESGPKTGRSVSPRGRYGSQGGRYHTPSGRSSSPQQQQWR